MSAGVFYALSVPVRLSRRLQPLLPFSSSELGQVLPARAAGAPGQCVLWPGTGEERGRGAPVFTPNPLKDGAGDEGPTWKCVRNTLNAAEMGF